jgi:two-component system, chemotaxis family, sensor kinase CheA
LPPSVPMEPCRLVSRQWMVARKIHGADRPLGRTAIMDEIVKDFLIESNENLDRLDQELVRLESDPRSTELLASIFRTIHTIKGSCGFLGFARLEKVAHAGESLLSRLREGQLVLTEEMTSGLLAMVDAVRHMMAAIQATEHDGDHDYPELLDELKRLQSENREEPPPSTVTAWPTEQNSGAEAPGSPDEVRIVEVPEEVAAASGSATDGFTDTAAVPSPAPQEAAATPNVTEARARETETETIRVGVTLLDKLMNLVGELVLARNQLLQFANATQDAGLQAVSQRLNLIASELQEEVMKTRMQPIGNIWNKFPRTVRDLALSCGKEVRLVMEGQDTELDRTIIEAIKDPLTHLVRNSIDHGIERPEQRAQVGKGSSGCLTLRAFHEGGQVNIEISDDGAGLNTERIRKKAIERGLISAQQAGRMQDRDVFNMIFLPGFSTAEKVTNVSGRGVGMDVVKTNVEKIGGMVDVQSTPGHGTTVRVKIPLTLAIVPALIVGCGEDRFAIPQVSLLELVRLEDPSKGIEMVHGSPVYRLRGRLLPLVHLDHELQLKRSPDDVTNAQTAANIVVLQAEDRQFGLVVDEITDTEEIVVKPMGKQLKGISAYSGATIMGDGRVALILDVLGLAQRAKVIAESREAALEESHDEVVKVAADDEHTMLLAENGRDGRVAIPLSVVARLEEFPSTVVERAGTQEVMQYRGQIIPLIRLSQIVTASAAAEDVSAESIQVVVYSAEGHTVGLIVDRIVDIVEEHAAMESLAPRTGVVGSFVTQSRVTDLLDMPAIVRAALPGLLEAMEQQAGGSA